MTSTDEILALAAAAAASRSAAAGTETSAEVTEADIDAFSAAAARGAGSDVVRVLRAIGPAGPMAANPAWTAWVTAAAVTAAASEAAGHGEGQRAGPVHPAWLAVFAAGTALSDSVESLPSGVTVTAAITAGMSAAAVTETGLADWGGWSSGTVAAVIGAGVTAGLLLGLTEPQLRATLSVCATQAAGLAAAEATQAFALQVGKAAFNGVEAALLARAGLTAPAEPLDGKRGLFALFG